MPPPFPNWRDVTLPPEVGRAQTMLMRTEQQLLYSLARDYARVEGSIVDAGCFLGGSTLALATGLRDNTRFQQRMQRALIHSYDRFILEPWTIGLFFPEGTPLNSSFEPIFRHNIEPVADLVSIHAGDVTTSEVPEESIEILFIDLAKHWTTSDFVVRAFFSKLVPGHSIVIQQDYLFHSWSGWLPVTMEFFSDLFEIIDHTGTNSVVFLYKKAAPPEAFSRNVIQSLTRSQIRDLAERAIARFDPEQQQILRQSQEHFEKLMQESNWP